MNVSRFVTQRVQDDGARRRNPGRRAFTFMPMERGFRLRGGACAWPSPLPRGMTARAAHGCLWCSA